MPRTKLAAIFSIVLFFGLFGLAKSSLATGVLRVDPANRRYFTDDSGKAVYLTGAHTWNSLIDEGPTDPPAAFNYTGYLDFLQQYNHNFIRLWISAELFKYSAEGSPTLYENPLIWLRTGPGNALDGKPKFDLTQLNQAYFDRLRARVIAARDRGIYVSVMLFEDWTLRHADSPWITSGHPFNIGNNINGINGDPNGYGNMSEIQTLNIPAVTAIQEAYVRKVIDTVNDLDNVLYEISNESLVGSTDWQYHMINYIHTYEAGKPKQHPVGMTGLTVGGNNAILFNSPAEWISPYKYDATEGYDTNPPAATGQKVMILDTDHLGCSEGGDWVWKSFCRGNNPISMDPIAILNGPINGNPDWPNNESARKAMGYTLTYAKKMNLAAMIPSSSSSDCSTTYCLRNPGNEYLIYQPNIGAFTANLLAGTYSYEWFNPSTGSVSGTGSLTAAAGSHSFTPPFSGDAVLYLKKAAGDTTPPNAPSGLSVH